MGSNRGVGEKTNLALKSCNGMRYICNQHKIYLTSFNKFDILEKVITPFSGRSLEADLQ